MRRRHVVCQLRDGILRSSRSLRETDGVLELNGPDVAYSKTTAFPDPDSGEGRKRAAFLDNSDRTWYP